MAIASDGFTVGENLTCQYRRSRRSPSPPPAHWRPHRGTIDQKRDRLFNHLEQKHSDIARQAPVPDFPKQTVPPRQ